MQKISKSRSIKTIILAVIMLMITAMLLTGCGSDTKNTIDTKVTNNGDVTLENVKIFTGDETIELGNIEADKEVEKPITYYNEKSITIQYVENGMLQTIEVNTNYKADYKNAAVVEITYEKGEEDVYEFTASTTSKLDHTLGIIDDFVWGIPLIALILIVGLLLTLRSKGVQFLHLGKAFKFMFKDEKGGVGEVSSFGALCTALSATIGTGNIVGVATAVCAGGPGALFWMEVAALFGMATKYAEGLLAVKYREVGPDGKVLGGPFYYIEKGLGKKWKWLAVLFAIFGVFVGLMGIGTITQVNGIASAVQNFFDPDSVSKISLFGNLYPTATVIAGVVVTIFVALVIIGGLKRIAKVSEVIVPFMAILYILCGLTIIVCNITRVPGAIATIVHGAFNPAAVTGGVVGTVFIAMQKGIARGIFSNEAGLGSAPIAAAAARTKEPVRQGLVCMTGTFIDTIIVCTITGLAIVITGAWQQPGLEGAAVTSYAFGQGLWFLPNSISTFMLMICLAFFAFTTILGWDYYSERCLQYLVGDRKGILMGYKILYIIAVFIGPFLTVSAVWTMADIVNGLMAFPNVIALILLSGVVAKETRDYIKRYKSNVLK